MKFIINGEAVEVPGGGSSEEVYSTEETKVGTWIDGKPLYRKVFSTMTPPSTESACVAVISERLNLAHLYGYFEFKNGDQVPIPYVTGTSAVSAWLTQTDIKMQVSSGFTSLPAIIVLEYTKTTD